MENRYPPRWLTVHFPHTSTAILKIDVMKRHFEYRPLNTYLNPGQAHVHALQSNAAYANYCKVAIGGTTEI